MRVFLDIEKLSWDKVRQQMEISRNRKMKKYKAKKWPNKIINKFNFKKIVAVFFFLNLLRIRRNLTGFI